MLKSSEDSTLAFFESLILEPNGINNLREAFFGGIEESFITINRSDEDVDVIYVNDRDDYKSPIKVKHNFKDYLKSRLSKEEQLTKCYLKSRSSKILSSIKPNKTFFSFIENT